MNQSFQSFGKEIVGEFTIANVSYFSEYGIWLGNIYWQMTFIYQIHQSFLHQNFAIYTIVKKSFQY